MKTSGSPLGTRISRTPQSSNGPLSPFMNLEQSNYQETDGVNTPGFHKLVRRGALLPMTSFAQFSSNGSASGSQFLTDPQGVNIWGDYPSLGALQPSWEITKDTLDSKLASYDAGPFVQAAAARIYSRSADALTFIAELKKTISGFRGLQKRLADLIRNPSFKRYGRAWLEGRYQWRTLMFDIADFNQALNHFDESRTRFSERVGTTFREIEMSTAVFNGQGAATGYFQYNDTYEIGVRGSVVADFRPQRFSFNPVVTAWELVPYSFVLDWFLSVGDAIEALSLGLTSEGQTSAGGYFISCERQFDLVLTSINLNGYTNYQRTITGHLTVTRTLRIPTSVSYLPHLRVNLDGFKLIDLAALIGLRTSRRK